MEIFTIRLNKLLKENKITMYKLAKDFKCSKATITNWCYGYNEPKATEITRLALYFNVTTDYLLGLEDDTGKKISISNSFNNSKINGGIKF